MIAIINGRIVLPNDVLENQVIIIENNKIIGFRNVAPVDAKIIDAKGLLVAPGFIDLHIHGCMGVDAMDGTASAIKTISANVAQYGTTAFLPTTMTMAREDIYKSLTTIRLLQGEMLAGASVLGAHLEGPFINSQYKGAQNAKYVVSPDYQWIDDFADVIKIATYAPEMDVDFKFTQQVKATTDIVLSVGHSGASYELVSEAIKHGCSHVTHLFNAMPGLHHRNPGVVGAALTHDVFVEVIADKIHVSEHLFKFIHRNKGCDHIILITDSIRAGCMKDGIYELGGQKTYVANQVAKLADGTLAGSVLTLNHAVRNFYQNTDASLPTVIKMASLNPAKAINISHCKGSLELGKDADIILLDDEFNCHLTLVNGVIVHQSPINN